MKGRMRPEMQAKQYVAKVRSRWYAFRIFATGNPRFYLFCQVDAFDCNTGLQFPVTKAALRPEVRRALAHG